MSAATASSGQSETARQEADRFLASAKRMLIDGAWIESETGATLAAIDPASEKVMGRFPAGSRADIDCAVKAARQAFEAGQWPLLTGKR